MNIAFPDSNILKYKSKIRSLTLPDPKDRHVLAAAIKSWIRFNIKNFPNSYIKSFGLKVLHPDELILKIIDENNSASYQALKNQVMRLRNPPLSIVEVFERNQKMWFT